MGIVQGLIASLKTASASYDSDAQAFFTGAGITDTTQKNAYNTLVTGIKSQGYYSKIKYLKPYLGGTASQHGYNAINTTLYESIYEGTLTHDANGVTGNGIDGGISTEYYANDFTTTNCSMGVYVRSYTPIGGLSVFMLDANSCGFYYYTLYGGTIGAVTDRILTTTGTQTGFIALNLESPTLSLYIAGTNIASGSSTAPSWNPPFIVIGNSSVGVYSNTNICFEYFADSLTSSEIIDFSTRVQTFQTALGRQV